MIKILLFIFVIVLISAITIWTIDNNGIIEIQWLDYFIKTDMLTAIIIIIISYCFLAIILSILSSIFSFKFSTIKKIFAPNKLKLLTKSVKKDQEAFNLILEILQDLENNDAKSASKKHKNLIKLNNNKNLNNFLLAKIHNVNGELKKSEDLLKEIK